MRYEFVGSFAEDEKAQIAQILQRFDTDVGFALGPSWTVLNRRLPARRHYVAVSHRGHGSFYGESMDELLETLQQGAST